MLLYFWKIIQFSNFFNVIFPLKEDCFEKLTPQNETRAYEQITNYTQWTKKTELIYTHTVKITYKKNNTFQIKTGALPLTF